MHNRYVAMLAAALAAWIFGAVWYGALSKPYQRALGLDPEACKDQKMPLMPMLVSFAAELVMAFLFAHLLYRLGAANWLTGVKIGLLLGVGFMAATTLVNNMFQKRTLMLTVIDSAHWIGVAVIEGAVLAALI